MVASTPSPSPPESSSALATADSLSPNSRSTRLPGGWVRRSSPRIGGLASAFGQSRRSSAGGPGRMTTTQPLGARRTSPGAVPARPIDTAEASHPCLSRGGCKLAAGLDAFGYDPAARNCLDLALQNLVHDELEPGHVRDQLDRAVVVGRAEAS